MEEKAPSQPRLKIAADYKAAIEECLVEMRRLHEQMDKDQAEIERLKVEARMITAHTDTVLDKIEAQLDALRTAA
ncbi:MAG TPA: hypothetical protein VFB38_09955 [Chthonomonadaceae bacterium]|nr:hypothetical protein [Chthonomonadaceae bacterium]